MAGNADLDVEQNEELDEGLAENDAEEEVSLERVDTEEDEADKDEEEAKRRASKLATKKPMIPKSRFDEILAKNRELERRLAERNQEEQDTQQRKARETLEAKVEEAEEAYDRALLDGDQEKRKQLRRQLRQLNQQLFTPDYTKVLEQSATVAQDKTIEQVYIAQLEVMYPQLAGDSSTYDAELVQSIVDLRNGFLNAGGYTPVAAMKRSIAMHKHLLASDTTATAKVRAQDALQKAVTTANAQPPASKNVGDSSSKFGKSKPLDVESMTPAQFAKLTLEQKKRLRGDYV